MMAWIAAAMVANEPQREMLLRNKLKFRNTETVK
jgi:hypothetical protein